VVVNPVAGYGRARRLLPWLRRHLAPLAPDATVVETEAPGHARELAKAAADAGHDRVLAVGGDGTAQEVVNGLLDDDGRLPLAILPEGSGNDLARGLGLPRDLLSALRIAVGDTFEAIDIGRASRGDGKSPRHFAAAGGVGFDAQVAAVMARPRRAWQRGRIGYLVSTLLELRRFQNRRLRLRLETPDGPREIERTVLMAAIANGAYYGGGMQICPGATVSDGWLDVCLVGDISRLEAVRQLPGIYRGRHVTHPAVEFIRARSVEISGDPQSLVHLDGEPFGGLPLQVDLLPLAIRVASASDGRPGTLDRVG
jgi:diacylglycerol kinase (ATP)